MSSNKDITLTVSGIKCDNCDFVDSSVKFEEYPQYINKKCDVCGEVLLTTSDYNSLMTLINFTKNINYENEDVSAKDDKINISLSLDGTGTFNIEKVEVIE